MKIVFIADALDTQNAGIHVYCKALLTAIDQLNTNHKIYVIRSKKTNDFEHLEEIVLPIGNTLKTNYRFRQFSSIPKIINEIKPDIAFETAHFGPFRLNNSIKRVTFIHDLTPLQFPKWHPKSSVLAHYIMMPYIFKNADKILTNSKHSESIIHDYFPLSKNKTAVTHLAAKPKSETILSEKETFEKFKIELPYLLFTGTLEPRKNLKTLIKAYENLPKENKPKLVLAGKKGWIADEVFEQIKNNPNIITTGFVSDAELTVLYQNALAFVFPSWYEGFGLPVLEAMQNNCAVLCSNTSVLPEIVGEAALLFDPNSTTDLQNKLTQLIENESLRTSLKAKGKLRLADFSWKKSAEDTLLVLEGLVL